MNEDPPSSNLSNSDQTSRIESSNNTNFEQITSNARDNIGLPNMAAVQSAPLIVSAAISNLTSSDAIPNIGVNNVSIY